MGMSDSFYDEDSKCPKCHRRVKQGWQTKRLDSLMESWHKGDFFQYTKMETIPEEERRRKYGEELLSPFLRKTKKYLQDTSLILNGKVPVHTSCENCNTWLEAYAKISDGKFDSIIGAEATREEKLLVIIPETAKMLREEFESRLSHLRESCNHGKSKGTIMERTTRHGAIRALLCQRCDKMLEVKNPKLRLEQFQKNTRGRLKHWKEEEHRADKALAKMATNRRRP